jgi:hypothetical protein
METGVAALLSQKSFRDPHFQRYIFLLFLVTLLAANLNPRRHRMMRVTMRVVVGGVVKPSEIPIWLVPGFRRDDVP